MKELMLLIHLMMSRVDECPTLKSLESIAVLRLGVGFQGSGQHRYTFHPESCGI
jgi:hypothetical protein